MGALEKIKSNPQVIQATDFIKANSKYFVYGMGSLLLVRTFFVKRKRKGGAK